MIKLTDKKIKEIKEASGQKLLFTIPINENETIYHFEDMRISVKKKENGTIGGSIKKYEEQLTTNEILEKVKQILEAE